MMPEHCKHVGIHRVDFELTPGTIEQELLDTKIYKNTDYLLLNNGDAWAVVRIGKTPRPGLFWKIKSVDILSKPANTVYLSTPDVDVLNRQAMTCAAMEYPNKTVIVKGKFEHVSFIQPEEPIEVTVLEVIPPSPPKLVTLVNDILKFISLPKPIKIYEKIIDIESMLEDPSEKDHTYVFPCRASGMSADKRFVFLDERPDLDHEKKSDVTLIGCDLSLKIFLNIYGYKPQFINICPVQLANDISSTGPILTKCCTIKKFEAEGNLYKLPWGVTYRDLEDALKAIVEWKMRKLEIEDCKMQSQKAKVKGKKF